MQKKEIVEILNKKVTELECRLKIIKDTGNTTSDEPMSLSELVLSVDKRLSSDRAKAE